MQEEIVNKVAQSGLVTLNLEQYAPTQAVVGMDIKEQLFQGLILREKDFRAWVDTHDWAAYAGKHVAIHCSADAIVPTWAYMLLTTRLAQAASVVFATPDHRRDELYRTALLQALDPAAYADARVILKGCGSVPISAYV
ncbi:MAG: DUF2480 family protein, partial [bacterium]